MRTLKNIDTKNTPVLNTVKLLKESRGPICGVSLALALLYIPAAHAQRAIVNPGFEDPDIPGDFVQWDASLIDGWYTTSQDNKIEVWTSEFQGVASSAGNQHIEMNSSYNGALYQNICFTNGERIQYTFDHRARNNGPETASFGIVDQSGAVIQSLATSAVYRDGLWHTISGDDIYTGPTGIQRLQFTTTDPGGGGNFLDNIQITLASYIEFGSVSFSDVEASGGNLPGLVVGGNVSADETLTVTITGGTAVEGQDYTQDGTTVFIPEGTYDSADETAFFAMPITILDNAFNEDDKTIEFAFSGGVNLVVADSSCGTIDSVTSYTIVNDDFITAEVESFSAINGPEGGATASVLSSDGLNGAAAMLSDVTLTNDGVFGPDGNPTSALSFDPNTGVITVAPGAAISGTYTVTYTVCENGRPSNCDSTSELVTVVDPSFTMTKTASSAGPYTAGDVVTYTYTVVNTGDQSIRNVAISDTHNGSDPAPAPQNETLLTDVSPAGDSTDAASNGSWDVLAPGDSVTFTGQYTVTQIDAETLD